MAKRATGMNPLLTTRLSASWQDFQNLVRPDRFQARYRQAISQATATNGSIVVGEIRRNIDTGEYARGRRPNASLTEMIKGENHPLVDTGKLPKLVKMAILDYRSVEVGFEGSPAETAWIAAIHDGAKIPVTDSMRLMFKLLTAAGNYAAVRARLTGRAAELFARAPYVWSPLGESTKFIKIPSRPFVREVVNSKKVQDVLAYNWQTAGAHAVAGFNVNYSTFRRIR